jgi:hypothetical protein
LADTLADQAPPARGDDSNIDPVTGEPVLLSESDAVADHPPIKDELTALIEDGKTYAEAELAFQKTRLSFAADRGKSALIYGVLAFGFVHLMLIALVVGAVIALAPTFGGWQATGIVVGVLLIATVILGLLIRSKVKAVAGAFASEEK